MSIGGAQFGVSLPVWPIFGVLLLTGGIATWCSVVPAVDRAVASSVPPPPAELAELAELPEPSEGALV